MGEYLSPAEALEIELSRNRFRRKRQVAAYIEAMDLGDVFTASAVDSLEEARAQLHLAACHREDSEISRFLLVGVLRDFADVTQTFADRLRQFEEEPEQLAFDIMED
jgi:hypothetical protein